MDNISSFPFQFYYLSLSISVVSLHYIIVILHNSSYLHFRKFRFIPISFFYVSVLAYSSSVFHEIFCFLLSVFSCTFLLKWSLIWASRITLTVTVLRDSRESVPSPGLSFSHERTIHFLNSFTFFEVIQFGSSYYLVFHLLRKIIFV